MNNCKVKRPNKICDRSNLNETAVLESEESYFVFLYKIHVSFLATTAQHPKSGRHLFHLFIAQLIVHMRPILILHLTCCFLTYRLIIIMSLSKPVTGYGVVGWTKKGEETLPNELVEPVSLKSLIIKGSPQVGKEVSMQFKNELWMGTILSLHGKYFSFPSLAPCTVGSISMFLKKSHD